MYFSPIIFFLQWAKNSEKRMVPVANLKTQVNTVALALQNDWNGYSWEGTAEIVGSFVQASSDSTVEKMGTSLGEKFLKIGKQQCHSQGWKQVHSFFCFFNMPE